MKSRRKAVRPVSAETLARRADAGRDVSASFTNAGRMMQPIEPKIQRVNVDFSAPMLAELDHAAEELNISRQAVIKTLVRRGLDEQYMHRANAHGPAARQR